MRRTEARHATRVALFVCTAASLGAYDRPSVSPDRFPPVGIAVMTGEDREDERWCMALPDTAAARVAAGDSITIVFPGDPDTPARAGILSARRAAHCHTEFPQPRWESYVSWDVSVLRPASSPASGPMVGLAIASPARWSWSDDGRLLADLDGDGVREEARRCLEGEGEHLTLWAGLEPARIRIAHEYFDWGAFVEPSCGPAEVAPLAPQGPTG